MKSFLKYILFITITFSAVSRASDDDQIFGTTDHLKVQNEYYGERKVISIRVYGDKVSAYYKDPNGKSWNDTLFKFTSKSEPYKEFIFDVLEHGRFTLIPPMTHDIEDLELIYKNKKYSFYEAIKYLSKTDQCGLGIVRCPSSDVAKQQGRNTTAPNTEGPFDRKEAKGDYMTRVNIF